MINKIKNTKQKPAHYRYRNQSSNSDLPLKRLLSDNARYADLINVIAFNGEHTLSEKDVIDCDTNISASFNSPASRTYLYKSRDIVRKVILGVNCAIIGIENQSFFDNSMVIRSLCYDALEYDKQLKEHKRRHRRKKDLPSHEYLSGTSSSDCYYPVITFVLKTFEGNIATDLHSLIHFDEYDENTSKLLKKYANNYIINIIDIHDIDYTKCTTDLKQIFGFLAHDKNLDELEQFVNENCKEFSSLSEEAYDSISALSRETGLLQHKIYDKHQGGTINMCKALEDMRNIARNEGISEGISIGHQSGLEEGRTAGLEEGIRILILDNLEEGIPQERIMEKLEKRFSLDKQSAIEYLNRYSVETA